MNKKQYLKSLENLELNAMKIYQWYSDNIERLYDIEKYNIKFSYAGENFIWFEGTEYNGEWKSVAKPIPLELLYFNDKEKKEYFNKYHQKKFKKGAFINV